MLNYIYLKEPIKFIFKIKRNFTHLIRSIGNFLKTLKNDNFNSFYTPNLSIKNIIFINPIKIKYKNSIPLKFKKKSTPFILDFDWDKKNQDLLNFEKKHHTYVTCEELFVKGLNIKSCKEYFFFKEQIKKLGEFKNCKNENDITIYLNKLLKLFDNIKKNGIKTNIDNNLEFMIDEEFNLVKIGGGNHRFAISRILKLKQVPIEIKVINARYLNKKFKNKININDLNDIIKNIETKYN